MTVFGIMKKLQFFSKCFPVSSPHSTLREKFVGNITSKNLKNRFEYFWKLFQAFLEFWKVLNSSEIFPVATLSSMEKKNPEESPQNNFKTCWNTFGIAYDCFRNYEKTLIFFRNVYKSRAPIVHWTKKVSGKIT